MTLELHRAKQIHYAPPRGDSEIISKVWTTSLKLQMFKMYVQIDKHAHVIGLLVMTKPYVHTYVTCR